MSIISTLFGKKPATQEQEVPVPVDHEALIQGLEAQLAELTAPAEEARRAEVARLERIAQLQREKAQVEQAKLESPLRAEAARLESALAPLVEAFPGHQQTAFDALVVAFEQNHKTATEAYLLSQLVQRHDVIRQQITDLAPAKRVAYPVPIGKIGFAVRDSAHHIDQTRTRANGRGDFDRATEYAAGRLRELGFDDLASQVEAVYCTVNGGLHPVYSDAPVSNLSFPATANTARTVLPNGDIRTQSHAGQRVITHG